MAEPIYCTECGFRLSVVDAEFAVETDEGLAHRECYPAETSTPPPTTPEEEEAENERRRDMGDPPLPPPSGYEYGPVETL